MKNIKFLLIAFIALFTLNACLPEDELEFVAKPQGDFTFTNSFLSNYVLPAENDTDNNIGVLFAWDTVDFEAATNVSYELQYSVLGDFTDAVMYDGIGATTDNQMTLTIGQLKTLATETYGYEAPNTGDLHFRLRAYPGESVSTTEQFSTPQTITVELLEVAAPVTGYELSTWGVVGSAYNNWGAFPDGQFYTTDDINEIVAYVSLVDGEIKFRENNEWGGDLGDANLDGILDADPDNNIAVTAGNYKIVINTSTFAYTIEEFSWGIVGSAYNDWGGAGPDAKFYYDYISNTFKVSVYLMDGEFKIRPNNEWGGDYGDANGDGFLDQDADNNISITEGHYTLTVNFDDLSYTIVEEEVWGGVGSAYNDWGGDGPDFALTHLRDDLYVGDIATLLDGELKFRPNNEWSGDYGDANADGFLDQDPDNNIAVTAGNYRIQIDFSTYEYQLNQIN